MLVEAGIVGLVALAAYRASRPGTGIMTPERRLVFQHALNKVDPPLTPDQLNELADIFDSQKLPAYSEILRLRSKVRAQSPELKAAHRAAYRKGMASTDPLSVRVLATAFEAQGKTASAASLRNYADGLEVAAATGPVGPPAPIVPSVPPPAPVTTAGPAAVAANGEDEFGTVEADEIESEFAGGHRRKAGKHHPKHGGGHKSHPHHRGAGGQGMQQGMQGMQQGGGGSDGGGGDSGGGGSSDGGGGGDDGSGGGDDGGGDDGGGDDSGASGEYGEDSFGGPSSLIIAASKSSANNSPVDAGGTPIGQQPNSQLVNPQDAAANLGMTDSQYQAFMNGQPVQ